MKLKLLLVAMLVPMLLQAQDSINLFELSMEELMNIEVVSASKKAEKITDAPSNISVVTAQNIKEWGCRDIKDVLKRVIGFQVIADRDEWVFAARGNVSDNNQKYLILIDGIRVNSIENFGPGNIIEMPNNLSNVKQIEIIRGPGSVVWGADALAGVVNIITKNGSELEKNINVAAAYGQDKYNTFDFQIGQKVSDNTDYIINATYGFQEGRKIKQDASAGFPILDSSTKFKYPPFGPYTTLLDRHSPGYMLQAKVRTGDFTLSAISFETEVYNRHFEFGSGRENYLTTNKNLIEGAYKKVLGKDFELTVKMGTFGNSAEYAPREQGNQSKHQSNIAWRDRGANTTVDVYKPFGDKINVSAGLGYIFTKCGPNQRLDNFGPDSIKNKVQGYWFDSYTEDHQIGGYLMASYSPIKYVRIVAGSRCDLNNQRGSDPYAISPRAALIFYPYKTGTYKLVYNKGYLRPANFQTIGDVTSETMDQAEFIINQQAGPALITANVFWQQLKGFIVISSDQKNFSNLGDYTSKGAELEVNSNINENLNIWVNGTYIIPEGQNFSPNIIYDNKRIDLNGNLLSYPTSNANLGLTARFLKKKLFISPALRYVAATKYRAIPATVVTNADKSVTVTDTESNYSKTPTFNFIDLNIGYEPNDKVGVYLYIDNLTDITSPTHMTIWNGTIGQYGRFVMGKVRVHF